MLKKRIIYFGQPALISCDGRCDKAWGRNSRPWRDPEAEEPDYLGDDELGTAPENPGTFEGGESKPSGVPLTDANRMNRWCARECERCKLSRPGEELERPRAEAKARDDEWSKIFDGEPLKRTPRPPSIYDWMRAGPEAWEEDAPLPARKREES